MKILFVLTFFLIGCVSKVERIPSSIDTNPQSTLLPYSFVLPSFIANDKIYRSKIKIGIIDTGVDWNHYYLKNFKSNLQKKEGAVDPIGHGTHVAGIVVKEMVNRIGRGIQDRVEIISYSYVRPNSTIDKNRERLISALKQALEDDVSFLNLSFSGPNFDQEEYDLLTQLSDKGVRIFVAAGNNGDSDPTYPCAYQIDNLACVANLNGDSLDLSSSYGPNVSMAEQGTEIYSTLPNNQFGFRTGTSMATPLALVKILKLELFLQDLELN